MNFWNLGELWSVSIDHKLFNTKFSTVSSLVKRFTASDHFQEIWWKKKVCWNAFSLLSENIFIKTVLWRHDALLKSNQPLWRELFHSISLVVNPLNGFEIFLSSDLPIIKKRNYRKIAKTRLEKLIYRSQLRCSRNFLASQFMLRRIRKAVK